MKKLSKLSVFALAGALAFSLAACSGGGNGDAAPPDATGAGDGGATPDKVYNIGICQLVKHDALDAATQGFKDVLTEQFGADGVKFTEGNASGDAPTCATIINGFLSDNVDLILANATAPLQSAHAATGEIPILGTSITDYATALDISEWNGTVGGNISGTSDLAPLDEQASMIQELFPDAQNVGLLYCSAEANSVYQVETISGYLEDMGYTCTPYAFTDSNDVAAVTQSACDNSDLIYLPTDNTAASNTEAIANVVLPAKVPVVAGEAGIRAGCGVFTLSIDYYELGRTTGEMAVKILRDGGDISTMPVEFAPTVTKMYNATNCEALNITPPDGYEVIG